MAEYWDLYDNDRNRLERTQLRGEMLEEGTFHVVVSVWTVNHENKLLMTLRSAEKELYPNLWENTSGSVVHGESSLEAALRELKEETGIEASEEEITFVGTARKASSFVDIYLVKKHIEPDSIILQQGETVDYRWVTFSELEEMDRQGLLAFPISFRFQQLREFFKPLLA